MLPKIFQFQNSLTSTTIIKMGIRIAIIIIAVTIVSYWHVMSNLESQVVEQLDKYITERGQRESALFLLAEDNHVILKKEFERRLELLGDIDPQEQFEQLLEENGINGLNGHRSVGGYRASIYNALPLESVQVLVDIMKQI